MWDAETTRILYKLPGHKGSVNGVDFHPKEPVGPSLALALPPWECAHSHFDADAPCPLEHSHTVASASTDKQIFLGELAAR